MKKCAYIFLGTFAAATSLLAACGGGGGGEASYAGQWLYVGRLLVNDCNVRIPSTATFNWTVNQNGSTVVVNSGQITLEGSTNEKDGFDVLARTSNPSNGCEAGYGIGFENASDGEAEAVVVIVSKCGSLSCTIGYGGIATQQTTSTAEGIISEDTMAEIGSSLVEPTKRRGRTTEGGLENAVEELLMNGLE